MRKHAQCLIKQLARTASLVLLSGIGTIALMRTAPGYFNDSRELDPEYARIARSELDERKQESIGHLSMRVLGGWMHGDVGRSTQYDLPVGELVWPRVKVTAKLLMTGLSCAWIGSLLLALLTGIRLGARAGTFIAGVNNALLAVPVGALCTICLLTGRGGPTTIIGLVVAARDFKLIHRLVRESSRSANLIYARAQGVSSSRLACFHLVPSILGDLRAIAAVSIILALSAAVPVEVLFDVPGVGKLAWSAALNRDLPLLTAITLMMASCIGVVTLATGSHSTQVVR